MPTVEHYDAARRGLRHQCAILGIVQCRVYLPHAITDDSATASWAVHSVLRRSRSSAGAFYGGVQRPAAASQRGTGRGGSHELVDGVRRGGALRQRPHERAAAVSGQRGPLQRPLHVRQRLAGRAEASAPLVASSQNLRAGCVLGAYLVRAPGVGDQQVRDGSESL